ncbi:MAG TPA: hypothetical protein VHY32_10145 [Caulobacteraceae bacterium]|jgi:hypothetical protein|nr:hypothetical protein [Caulobacteraceae bacterium]
MKRPLAYWSSGGEVVAVGGQVLSTEDQGALGGLHLDEAQAAARAEDWEAGLSALRRVRQLLEAVDAGARWRRAGGRIRR